MNPELLLEIESLISQSIFIIFMGYFQVLRRTKMFIIAFIGSILWMIFDLIESPASGMTTGVYAFNLPAYLWIIAIVWLTILYGIGRLLGDFDKEGI